MSFIKSIRSFLFGHRTSTHRTPRPAWTGQEGYGWKVTPTPVKTAPSRYQTPTALPHAVRADRMVTIPRHVYDDACPTSLIPRIPRGGVVTSRIAHSLTGDDACAKATAAVLAGDWDTALAGLLEYVALHPMDA